MKFHRKLKINLPYDPAIPLVGIYISKEIEISMAKRHALQCATYHNLQHRLNLSVY